LDDHQVFIKRFSIDKNHPRNRNFGGSNKNTKDSQNAASAQKSELQQKSLSVPAKKKFALKRLPQNNGWQQIHQQKIELKV